MSPSIGWSIISNTTGWSGPMIWPPSEMPKTSPLTKPRLTSCYQNEIRRQRLSINLMLSDDSVGNCNFCVPISWKTFSGLEHSGLSYPVRIFGLEKNFRLEITCQPSAVISGNENDEYFSTGTDLEQWGLLHSAENFLWKWNIQSKWLKEANPIECIKPGVGPWPLASMPREDFGMFLIIEICRPVRMQSHNQ